MAMVIQKANEARMLMIQRHRKQGQGFQQMREAPLKMALSITPPPSNVTSTIFRVLSAVEKFSTNHPSRRNPPIAKLLNAQLDKALFIKGLPDNPGAPLSKRLFAAGAHVIT